MQQGIKYNRMLINSSQVEKLLMQLDGPICDSGFLVLVARQQYSSVFKRTFAKVCLSVEGVRSAAGECARTWVCVLCTPWLVHVNFFLHWFNVTSLWKKNKKNTTKDWMNQLVWLHSCLSAGVLGWTGVVWPSHRRHRVLCRLESAVECLAVDWKQTEDARIRVKNPKLFLPL